MKSLIPDIETRSIKNIKSHQLEMLKKTLGYVQENSSFYQKYFIAHHVNVDDIQSLEDLQKIPAVSKKELQEHNRDFWCVGQDKLIDYCNTSGTEGQPVTIPLTDKDLNRLAYNESISLACAGGNEKEIYQLMTTIDRRFMAGLAYAEGVRLLGAGLIRVGPALSELQWLNIKELHPTVLIAVPSFLIKLIEYAEKHKIDYRNSSIKKAVCIGEAIRDDNLKLNALGKRITEKWGIELYSTYASTEMGTAFTECEEGQGGHEHPELIITEILDNNNNPVEDGESGELAITTLGVEGMPLVRFKTGDICRKYTDPCACGRNTARLGPLLGRKNHMIKYKGTTIYPPAIFDVLDHQDYISLYCVEIFSDEFGSDIINVKFSAEREFDNEELKKHFKTRLRATPNLEEMSFEELFRIVHPKNSRKPVKLLDRR